MVEPLASCEWWLRVVPYSNECSWEESEIGMAMDKPTKALLDGV